jgi:hypothetical protein
MRIAALLVVVVTLGGPLLGDDTFPINVYPCPKAETAPVIDGKLDDAVWQQAPVVPGFSILETGATATPQTSFRVLWDDTCLYVGVHCDEPLSGQLNPVLYPEDDHAIFGNETIELFVDPNHTHDLYYQFAVDAAGSRYDSERDVPLWDSGAQVASVVGQGFWSTEIAVPWRVLKATPQAGKVLGFNVNRDRILGGKAWHTWARVNNAFHDPERFAHLVLSGTPEMIASRAEEFRQGGRRGPITVYSTAGLAQTSYAKLAEIAFADLEKRLAGLDEVVRQEQDAAAAAAIQKYVATSRTTLASLRQRAANGLDGAVWTRLDIELQSLQVQLGTTATEARLKALLERI